MTARLRALLLALALLGATAGTAGAITDPEDAPLPFPADTCRTLIALGAPFLFVTETEWPYSVVPTGRPR